ncbi:hypothetical protein ID852_15785 [Xenorhabdus sp. 42]|uniref:Uncharacterized protein n=1 Tax=Xenorhabdus szentirmaii TaxID=290112 RepID=A0AAW3YXC7_9GAMM|nr:MULTISPECIES: ABC-three component system middle component 6 [unclassified Xenorhabdus]MBD2794474.1 hypothetical protein [Xenorhabdus sp. CUL]MBD2801516.1 hypothetical protein [Xenorhabdus sp. M]MBD2822118.1 hypothetical protein [Xenorhabdus sp. 42]MBD2826853.1 hypothetical protein [Xenorhabdus sp. 5]
MITIDTDPKANLIYLGGYIIKLFQNSNSRRIEITILYDYVNDFIELSFELFLYSLDWLFIIDVIELDENGDVIYAPK